MGDPSEKIQCKRHGESYATFICGHLVAGEGLGHFSGDIDDPRPDVWCNECDLILAEEGGWNDRSEEFAQVKVVCAGCYDEIRRRNLTTVEDVNNGINTIWFLQNVRDRHELHPDTFSIPDASIREGVKAGDGVKLIFILPTEVTNEFQGERMWVEVNGRDHVGYIGTLHSTPDTKGSISEGEKVIFGPEHILDHIQDVV